jgi:thiol-disulfide isomerase/thioredoxin
MADLTEPAVDDGIDAQEPADATSAPRRGRRSLDGRTLAIAALIGLIAALITALVGSALLSDDEPKAGMDLQESSPIQTAKLLAQPLDAPGGGTTSLGNLREEGKATLINLFASNCVPCVKEMPLLTAAHEDNPDITFVGVATQDDDAKARALVERTKITYPWALDPTGELFYEAKGIGMPTTVLLSADGNVLDSKTGPFHTAAELQAFLDQAS